MINFLTKFISFMGGFIFFVKNYTNHFDLIEKRIVSIDSKINSVDKKINSLIMLSNITNHKNNVQVVFLLHNLNSWYSLCEIYDNFCKIDQVKVSIIIIEKENSPYCAAKFLKEMGMNFIDLSNSDVYQIYSILASIDPSVVFRQSPWDDDVNEKFSAINLSNFKVVYIPYYSLNVVKFYEEKTGFNYQVNQNLHLISWKIYCESKESYNEYMTDFIGDKSKILYLGNSKLNYINNYFLNNNINNIKGERIRILWAPHHSVTNDWLGFGTFHENCLHFLNLAKKNIFEIKLRPHPLLFKVMSDIYPDIFNDFLSQWDVLENTSIDDSWDYLKSFEWSDFLITDGISFLSEYPLTMKPIIYLDSGRHCTLNDNGVVALKCSYSALGFDDVEKYIDLYKNNKLKPKFEAVVEFKKYFDIGDNDVSKLIVNDILFSLSDSIK